MRGLLAVGTSALVVLTALVTVPQASGATASCNTLGAGGDWPTAGHDLRNTRSQPAETLIGRSNINNLKKAWTFVPTENGTGATLASTPTELGGCVYIGSSLGDVYALSVTDGSTVWNQRMSFGTAGLGGAIVGSIALDATRAYVLVNDQATGNGTSGPYAVALNRLTGALLWTSPRFATGNGYYTNASPIVYNGMVVAGYSPAEADPTGQGGLVALDAATGALLKNITTVPPDRQAQGYAGGGIWDSVAVDGSGFGYAGTGNPFSKTKQDPNTDAIIKFDLRKTSPTFGQIVAAYPGNVDQYTSTLQALADSPLCAASAPAFENSFFDDPICGQLDLDFGASPNLFTINARQVVGNLQKAGVYHVAYTSTMTKAWATIVGTPCFVCNAASTAAGQGKVYGEATLGGQEFALNQTSGTPAWLAAVGDVIHYEAQALANNVVYTVDGLNFLDAWDATTSLPLLKRAILLDAKQLYVPGSSTGVAIARHHLIASLGSLDFGVSGVPQSGTLVAYTP